MPKPEALLHVTVAALPGFEGDARMKAHQLVPQEHLEIQAARRLGRPLGLPLWPF
jgi:hypothetical protein